LRRSIKTQPS